MRSKLTKIALTAVFGLALAFPFSCSINLNGDGNLSSSSGGTGGEQSYNYCITALGCIPGPFTASICSGQLANGCPNNPTNNPSSSSGNSTIGAPAAPTGLRATASSNTITVSWNPVAGAVWYVLYISIDGFATYDSMLVSGTSYTESDIPPGTYYFAVTAYNANEDESEPSKAAFVTVGGSTSGPGTAFTTIADMKTWLASQPDNTPSTPYTVKLNVSTLGGSSTANASVGKALRDNPTKYVILDLSGSTFSSIDGNAFGSSTANNISLTLVGIVIPSTVTTIGDNAFRGTNITSINIPNSVRIIGNNAFAGCNNLTSVTIPNSVTSLGSSAFEGCKGLTSVIIGSGVTSIGGNAFKGCTSLTSVTIPSSVASMGNWAFDGCSSLATVKFEGSDIASFGSYTFVNSTASNNLKTAYTAGGAGTYIRSGNNWTKQ